MADTVLQVDGDLDIYFVMRMPSYAVFRIYYL